LKKRTAFTAVPQSRRNQQLYGTSVGFASVLVQRGEGPNFPLPIGVVKTFNLSAQGDCTISSHFMACFMLLFEFFPWRKLMHMLSPEPYFKQVSEPRRQTKNKKHRLSDILVITLYGVLVGCRIWPFAGSVVEDVVVA
jgi:hypothetical protein